MITEFGPIGPWEVGDDKADWGAAIEESSHEKAKRYPLAHETAIAEKPRRCLGTFPFYWGFKQETTSTWFGMLLPNGAHLEAVDTMAEAWTGRLPTNRVPEIHSLNSSAKLKKVKKSSLHKAYIKVIMRYMIGSKPALTATMRGGKMPLSSRSLWMGLWRTGQWPLRPLLSIHVEAVKLWMKKLQFHKRPAPPTSPWSKARNLSNGL